MARKAKVAVEAEVEVGQTIVLDGAAITAEEAKPYPTEGEAIAWAKEQGYNITDDLPGREIIVDFFRGIMNTPDDLPADLIYCQWRTKDEALHAVVAPLEGMTPGGLMLAINNAPADARPYLNRLLSIYTAFGGWVTQCLAFDWILEHTEVPDALSPGE